MLLLLLYGAYPGIFIGQSRGHYRRSVHEGVNNNFTVNVSQQDSMAKGTYNAIFVIYKFNYREKKQRMFFFFSFLKGRHEKRIVINEEKYNCSQKSLHIRVDFFPG